MKARGTSGTGRHANELPLRPSDERALRESLDAVVAKLREHEALLVGLKLGASENHAAPRVSPSGSHLRVAWSRPEVPAAAPVSYAIGVEQAHFQAEQTTPPRRVPHPDYTESSFQQGPEHPPAVDEAHLPGRPIARPDRNSQPQRLHREARRVSGRNDLDPIPAMEPAPQTAVLIDNGRLKPKPRSARAFRAWMSATIAVFMSLATAAGIVLMPGQADRQKWPGERLSLEEFESRQRDAAATDHARQAPASELPTALNPSNLNERVDDVAPTRQPLSRSDSENAGNVGVAGAPAQEGLHHIPGTQREVERLGDKAPSASGLGVSPKPDNKVFDQGANFSPQPLVQGDVVSEAVPADARDLLQPSTGEQAQAVTGAHSAPDVQMANLIPPPARKPKLSLRPRTREKEAAGRGNERSRMAGVSQQGASPMLFVPVLILVKNPTAALEVYSRVRERHPALLGTKTAAAKSVTRDNETWYRVVLQPAGTRDEAQSVCQHLGAEGRALGCSVLPVSAP